MSLTPKVMDTLLILVENHGHVLTKLALMERLWPKSFVEESSLTQNISLLRKKLAENGATEEYIETIPKRGYRFKGVVIEVKTDSSKLSTGNVIESSTHSDNKIKALVGVGVATIILMSGLISYWFGSRRSG